MAVTGKVQDVRREFEFEWRIDNFFSLPVEEGSFCTSPWFSFADESWYLGICPNGDSSDNSPGYISLYLYKYVSGPPTSVTFSLGLKTIDGKTYEEVQYTHVFEEDEGYGCPLFMKRSTLLEKKVVLVPSDTLTVVCTVEHYPESTDDAGNNETAMCPHCKKFFAARYTPSHEQKCLNKPIRCPTSGNVVKLRKWFDHECEETKVKAGKEDLREKQYDHSRKTCEQGEEEISNKERSMCLHCKKFFAARYTPSHEQKCLNKPIKCPTCEDVVELRKWFDHDCKKTRLKAGKEDLGEKKSDVSRKTSKQGEEEIRIDTLNRDLKEILLSGNITDIVLKVQDQESRAHRCILAARSPVFLTILMHDIKEEVTAVVDIEDIDSTSFPDFLRYLFTGRSDNLTLENAVKLYTIADKYQIKKLKKNCMEHMLANISVDSFCDVFAMSHIYDNQDLKEACIQFFSANSLDIITSSKWQTFLAENVVIGNELLIKYVKLHK